MGNEVDWAVVQLAYQKGEGTCKELAEKYGLTVKQVSHRCTREGWKKEAKLIGELVGKRVVESLAEKKIERINAHHSLVIPIAEKLIKGVEKTYDDMNGQALEPSELQGLSMALKTANSTALLNLGFVEASKVDVTSGGLSLHQNALAVLQSCQKLKESGQLPSSESIDIEAVLQEHEQAKKQEEGGK